MEKVTVGVINYNGLGTLPEVMASIERLDYPDYEVVVVDNCSSDGSRQWLQTHYAGVTCIALQSNRGSAAAKNEILHHATTRYAFIIDNDIVLERETLTRLMGVMRSVPKAALCHPEICDPNDPEVHHYNGGWIHYLCALVPRPPIASGQRRPEWEPFDVVSGAALLIDRPLALQFGAFDEDYFFNWEDGDFTIRFTLAGYQCLNVPAATVQHRSKPRGTSKVFYQVRNRWFFILKFYALRTLLLAAPAFLFYELSQAFFLTLKGAGKDYLRGTWQAWRRLPATLRKRRAFQPYKKLSDREWLRGGKMYVPAGLMKGGIIQAAKKASDGFLQVYWSVIRPAI